MFGEWLSLVEHLLREQGVGGSNPLSPTIQNQKDAVILAPGENSIDVDFEGGSNFEFNTPTIRSAFPCSKPRRQRLRRQAVRTSLVDCCNLPPHLQNVPVDGQFYCVAAVGYSFARPPLSLRSGLLTSSLNSYRAENLGDVGV